MAARPAAAWRPARRLAALIGCGPAGIGIWTGLPGRPAVLVGPFFTLAVRVRRVTGREPLQPAPQFLPLAAR
jgi:hypothetical protein